MKTYLISIVLILVFASCVKEDLPSCYSFVIQKERFYVHDNDTLLPNLPLCPEVDTLCGLTSVELNAYLLEHEYEYVDVNYNGTVILHTCDGVKTFSDGCTVVVSQTVEYKKLNLIY